MLPTRGKAVERQPFPRQHQFPRRPVIKWIPLYGEPAKPEIGAIRRELVARPRRRARGRVADTNRNLVVFPNLVINDGSSVTVRTFYPQGPDKMHVTAWALGRGGRERARGGNAFSLSTAPAVCHARRRGGA